MGDFTIKGGSYCPCCRGVCGLDHDHTLQELDERPYRRDALAARDAALSRITADNEAMREALEDRELFIRAMLDIGSYWRVNTREFCHRGICHSLQVKDGIPQLTGHLREQLRSALTRADTGEVGYGGQK